MRRLTVPLVITVAAAALAAGIGCSSEPDPGAGLTGGGTGKGGSVNVGKGGSSTTSGGSLGAGGTAATGTGGSISVGGGTSGSAGSAGNIGAAGACTGTTATGQKGNGAVVLFLVDTSLSMADPPGGRGGGGRGMGGMAQQSKMASTQTALNAAFTTLSPSLNVGLVFYPQVEVMAMPCFDATVEVPINVLDANQLTLLTTAVTGVTPDGSTPTHDAYAFAVQTLQASTAAGDKYIVLITDGQPTYSLNCMGDGVTGVDLGTTGPLIDAAAAAFAAGIKTFVVGSPGSEAARGALSAMARVGGTGPAGCMDTGMPAYCHFDMTTSTDFTGSLQTALGAITQQIPVDCAFDLPRPPNGMQLDLNQVNITVTNDDGTTTEIGRDPAGDCATDGWVYVGDPPTKVQLCGALCDSVNAQTMPGIAVKFGCGQRVNPPR